MRIGQNEEPFLASHIAARVGARVPKLPMPVLHHQMGHVRRRPFASDRREPAQYDNEGRPHRHRLRLWNKAELSASYRPALVVRLVRGRRFQVCTEGAHDLMAAVALHHDRVVGRRADDLKLQSLLAVPRPLRLKKR